jgi:MoxR-like ATPase
MSFQIYKKEGTSQLPAFQANPKINDPSFYIPSAELVDAVNVALNLGQPLLLTGEPGTGKTQLAYHISQQFGLGEPLVFNAQTTSTATDLFYKYDALAHFQYNQNNAAPLSIAELETRFIHYNALGEAIRQQKRVVVLIDEIDKAPRDLPNDVLFAIEKLRFRIPELNNKSYETVAAARPIIVITSNSEKNLPDAFLRRVIYYHIPFPSEANLIQILSAKTDGFTEGELKSVVQHFQDVRDLKLKKAPATAELIYWALLLRQMNFPMQKLGNGSFSAAEKGQLLMSYAVLAKNREDLEVLKGNI